MATYEIFSTGTAQNYGTYEGKTPESAIRAMLEDACCYDEPSKTAWEAVEVDCNYDEEAIREDEARARASEMRAEIDAGLAGSDFYLRRYGDGEEVWAWGFDEPLASNRT